MRAESMANVCWTSQVCCVANLCNYLFVVYFLCLVTENKDLFRSNHMWRYTIATLARNCVDPSWLGNLQLNLQIRKLQNSLMMTKRLILESFTLYWFLTLIWTIHSIVCQVSFHCCFYPLKDIVFFKVVKKGWMGAELFPPPVLKIYW